MAETATNIKRVAVFGAGVMGGGIAAQMADAGAEVTLLDLVPTEPRTAMCWPRLRSRHRGKVTPGLCLPQQGRVDHLWQPGG